MSKKSTEIESRSAVAREWEVTANGHKTSFRSNKNAQKLDSVSNMYAIHTQCIVCKYTKNHWIDILNRWVLQSVNKEPDSTTDVLLPTSIVVDWF